MKVTTRSRRTQLITQLTLLSVMAALGWQVPSAAGTLNLSQHQARAPVPADSCSQQVMGRMVHSNLAYKR